MMPDGKKIDFRLSDFESYSAAEEVVIKSLQMGKEKRKIEKILFMSAEINALNQALNSGSNMNDLSFIPLLLIAPEGYIIKS